ncbi:hypothetical protein EMCRGX_G003965 [Ephydatia muelleri]
MQGSNYVCPSCFHLLRRRCFAPDGFDAVLVQNFVLQWCSGGCPAPYCDQLQHHRPPPLHFLHVHVLQSRPQALHSSWNVVLGVISAAASLSSHVHHEEDSPPGGPPDPESDTNDIVIILFINKIINPDKSFGSSDPMCILLQLSSLLVEHTAPNIHDSNKNYVGLGPDCYHKTHKGSPRCTQPLAPSLDWQIVWQIHVHEDWTTYPRRSLQPVPHTPAGAGRGGYKGIPNGLKQSRPVPTNRTPLRRAYS